MTENSDNKAKKTPDMLVKDGAYSGTRMTDLAIRPEVKGEAYSAINMTNLANRKPKVDTGNSGQSNENQS